MVEFKALKHSRQYGVILESGNTEIFIKSLLIYFLFKFKVLFLKIFNVNKILKLTKFTIINYTSLRVLNIINKVSIEIVILSIC
jgi:hypothetical protein